MVNEKGEVLTNEAQWKIGTEARTIWREIEDVTSSIVLGSACKLVPNEGKEIDCDLVIESAKRIVKAAGYKVEKKP